MTTIAITIGILAALAVTAIYLVRRAVTSARETPPDAPTRATVIRNAPTHAVQSRVDQLRARGRKGK